MKNPELVEYHTNNLCRTCLKHIMESNKYDIFLVPNLVKWLSVCTSLMIDESDEFPKNVCDICYQKIQEFYEFREKCLESIKNFEEIKHNVIFITESKLNTGLEIENDITEKQLKIENNEKYKKNDDNTTYFSEDSKPNQIIENENISDIEEDNDNDDDDDDDYDGDDIYLQPEIKTNDSDNSNSNEEDENDDDDDDDEEEEEQKIKSRRNKKLKNELSKTKRSRENFNCNVCNKNFFKKEMFDAHMRVHAGLQPWECSVCKKQYRQYNSLREHLKYVHGPKDELEPFSCTYEGCGKNYKYKDTLKKHIKKIHTEKGKIKKSYICEECGKSISTLAGLKSHRLTHTGEYPFKCDVCSKRYRIKCKLNEHMKRHIGIKNFICSICGLKKYTQHELNVHMKFHTKEKLAKCKFCNYTSINAANVIQHQTIGQCTINLYECSCCEKSFRKSEQLKNHEFVHTGEKPYECHICGRAFSKKRLMTRHINRHMKKIAKTDATTTTTTTPTAFVPIATAIISTPEPTATAKITTKNPVVVHNQK